MAEDNPYRRPLSEPGMMADGALAELPVREPQRRPAARGLEWLADAWTLFLKRPVVWLLAAFLLWTVVALVNLVSMFIPFIGSVAPTVLSPVFGVGLLQLAHAADRGEVMALGDIFAGFRRQTGPLLGLGGLILLVIFALVVLTMVSLFVILGGDFLQQMKAVESAGAAPGVAGPDMLLGVAAFVLVFLTLLMLMMAAIWFAPALVYFGDVHPARALLLSLRAVLRNVLSLSVYGLALIGFSLLAMLLPLLLLAAPVLLAGSLPDSAAETWALMSSGMLGMTAILLFPLAGLIVGAVSVISIYTSFRDIFIAPRALR